ncbi:hypothetical protein B0J13DRAFT_610405 [Dactylonectria estremocensis]|uniref:Uncharacterized protein n=1 Tax=Dactylonectria estremocensis TaxID=1079267 RepID=A0A9P9E933_9HYPO|nr:hypothetical protein B0J13DRAFT_610405 [Dactylonectria estremocensis]
MENVRSTTARLRRTFQYPIDEDLTDSQPEALDEEEQEHLIETLAAENAARDAQFRSLLVAIPIVATIPYIPSLFRPSTTLLALLSLTSLLSTAYLLHHLPPAASGIAVLDAWARVKTPRPTRAPSQVHDDDDDDDDEGVAYAPRGRRRKRRTSFSFVERSSPLQIYLPYLNLGLGVMLVLMSWVVGRAGNTAVWTGMGYLPLLVYLVVLVSKVVMSSVDPEKELTALKYDFKGA